MMEWISVKDKKPEQDAMVIVKNHKGFMKNVRALYYYNDDLFLLYDPRYYESIVLEVTHWFPLPD